MTQTAERPNPTPVRFSAAELERLDQHCNLAGIPRNAAVRTAVTEYLNRESTTDAAVGAAFRRAGLLDHQAAGGVERLPEPTRDGAG